MALNSQDQKIAAMQTHFQEDLVKQIKRIAGEPEVDAFLGGYMGNNHPRFAITTPALRAIAKDWSRSHRDLSAPQFVELITSLIEGKTSTEKILAGILLGYSSKEQRRFHPEIMEQWLNHLVGWAEVDAVCTGDFSARQLPAEWPKWKRLVIRLSKAENIQHRRASLVLFCSPLSRVKDPRLAEAVLKNVERLKFEKEVLITKAVSWVLRSMIKHYRPEVTSYLETNANTLPKIAVRETLIKLKTGKKTKTPRERID